jgi:hypothetical protein
MVAHSPRVWVVDIRNEISGIRELTQGADLEMFANNWVL